MVRIIVKIQVLGDVSIVSIIISKWIHYSFNEYPNTNATHGLHID